MQRWRWKLALNSFFSRTVSERAVHKVWFPQAIEPPGIAPAHHGTGAPRLAVPDHDDIRGWRDIVAWLDLRHGCRPVPVHQACPRIG